MDTKDPLFEDKTQCFCFTEWLRHYPLHGLTVLDYFKHSQFWKPEFDYDPLAVTKDGKIRVEQREEQSDVAFIIQKRDRNTRELLSQYYVVRWDLPPDPDQNRDQTIPAGTVFPMPDIHSVLRMNLAASLHFLRSAFVDMTRALGGLDAGVDGSAQEAKHKQTGGGDEAAGERTVHTASAAGSASSPAATGAETGEEKEKGEKASAGAGKSRAAARRRPARAGAGAGAEDEAEADPAYAQIVDQALAALFRNEI